MRDARSSYSKRLMLFVAGLLFSSAAALPVSVGAQEISAHFLADLGNVTVMEVNGNFDVNTPEGLLNTAPRQAVAKEFFRTHKDEYDFIAIFSNFDYQLPPDAVAYYTSIKNDIQGIGQQIFDNSSAYGSNGRLQGTIDMWNLLKLASNPIDPKFNFTVDTLIHETMHRWGAYVHFKDWNGAESKSILGYQDAHWSFLFDSGGSTIYGNKWRVNGDGTFTSTAVRKYYSPIDLYLMGMIDKSKVPPTLLIENPAIDPAKMPQIGTTISGTPRTVAIDDIIAVGGERIPAAKDSRKKFKTAFIYLVTPGTFNPDDLYALESLRNAYLTRFSILTDGQGLVEVAATPLENLPANPGIHPPATVPRNLPPNVYDGITWLSGYQQADGSWTDFSLTTERDTAETVTTLQQFPSAASVFQKGLSWLGGNGSANTDFLARRIEATVQSGGDVATLVRALQKLRNPDGGWGSGTGFVSNPTDTGLALKALSSTGFSDSLVLSQAISWLRTAQNQDGGWSGGDSVSTIQPTAAALTAFNIQRKAYSLDEPVTRAVAFLAGKQNTDGGFGNSPSTVYDTAMAVTALQTANADRQILDRGVAYLQGLQSGDGSWNSSPFQTALAVRAVWNGSIEPDLSVKMEDIAIIPEKLTSIPTNAVLSATIQNLGRTDVPTARVVVYDGIAASAKMVAEQIAAFPGQSQVTLTFSIPVTDGSGHSFKVVVDPDSQVVESNKNNNSAVKHLSPDITYDFEVLASDITVTSNPVDIGNDVKISVKVSNSGTSDAFSVPVRIFIARQGAPLEIAKVTLDIPSGGAANKDVIWRSSLAGGNLPLTVQIDPDNAFTEISKANNSATVALTVNASTLPNLSVSYKEMVITPGPALEGGSASISVLVKNDGYSAVENVKVNIFKGATSSDGVLLGTSIIPVIAAGQSVRVTADWAAIAESGARIISVQVDLDNTILELARDDNFTFTTLDILSLPDLAISANSVVVNPATPKTGDQVKVAVTVQNAGDQAVLDVVVRALEDGKVIGSTIIPLVNGNSQATADISFINSGKSGTHQIRVIVDPDNSIVERTKDNNSAVKIFSIQDANLWLTEPYISPNGDGIKDTTDFSFRLAAPDKVVVQVVNRKGVVVRTFSGSELDNTTGSTITWDGKNDGGSVVEDGIYQLNVVGSNSAVLASLPVEVDTNRSPLMDAFGTKYLLENNQTCMLPQYYNMQWLPDESGLFFNLYPDKNSQYDGGIYTMSPTGDDIIRLVPSEWNSIDNQDIYYNFELKDLSLDGSRVVFDRFKTARTFVRYGYDWWSGSGYYPIYDYVYAHSLWMVNTDGSNLTQLTDERTSAVNQENGEYYVLKWSPDGRRVAVLDALGLSVINIDTKLASTPIALGNGDQPSIWWAEDGQEVIATSQNPISVVRADASGNGSLSGNIANGSIIGRMRGNKLLVDAYDSVSYLRQTLIYSPATGSFINVNIDLPYYNNITFSPDGRYAVKKEAVRKSGINRMTLFDSSGNVSVIAEREKDESIPCSYECDDPTGIGASAWSTDSSRFAFLDTSYDSVNNLLKEELVIYESLTGNSRRILMGNFPAVGEINYSWAVSQILWMKDKTHLFVKTYDGTFLLNTEDGSRSEYLPFGSVNFLELSPNERYLSYEQYDDSNSSCYPKGYNQWAMSSLLNLTADLRILKSNSLAIIKGTAADKNFAGYKLEYSDAKAPGEWNLITLPSDVPVVDGIFTNWVPPYVGTFLVRLTVWDKAGNQMVSQQRVSWGLYSSITNIYKSLEYFSPNGDGVKDTVELNYRVLEPVHLEFNIYDASGNLVRTISKEHLNPTTDYISWDGRNGSGMLVPDGKYSIKIANFEFFVTVDNTQPTAELYFTNIYYDTEYYNLAVDLLGKATDNSFKSWSVEFGEGDNPQEWVLVVGGNEPIVSKSPEGIDIIKRYWFGANNSYPGQNWLGFIGKKLRLIVEDLAGNRKTIIAEKLSQEVRGIELDGFSLDYMEVNFIEALRGNSTHKLIGFQTVEMPVNRISLEYGYRPDSKLPIVWGTLPSSIITDEHQPRRYTIKFNDSDIPLTAEMIRIKAVDSQGQEFYSKDYLIDRRFDVGIADCSVYPFITQNIDLAEFEMQVSSVGDSRYNNWTTYYTRMAPFESLPWFPGDIPRHAASAYDQLPLIHGYDYYVRMVGRTVESKVVTSKFLPLPKCSQIKPIIIYKEAECGSLSRTVKISTDYSKVSIMNDIIFGQGKMTSLSYSISDAVDGSFKLLRRFDLTSTNIFYAADIDLDTSEMPEGRYSVKVDLGYFDLTLNKEHFISGTVPLVVDRVLPTAKITYPAGNSLKICPNRMTTGGLSWPGIPVEVVGKDNNGVAINYMDYGVGQNPDNWLPGMTYETVKGKVQSTKIQKENSISGLIGVWDVTEKKSKEYSLKLKVVDNSGNASCTTSTFSFDLPVEIGALSLDKKLFSPNGDGRMDDVSLNYQIDKDVSLDIKVFKTINQPDGSYALESTPIRNLVTASHHYGGLGAVIWDGKDDAAQFVPDGQYGIAVYATDSCGNTAMKWLKVEVDNTPPSAAITYPVQTAPLSVGNIIEIKGLVTDPHFANFRLEAGEGENPATWNQVATGIAPINYNTLGVWNSFGLQGIWTLRLSAEDSLGNKIATTSTIDLGVRENLIKVYTATPTLFSPNGDLKRDTTHISYEVTDACQIKVDVLDGTGSVLRTFMGSTNSAAVGSFDWDGKTAGSDIAPDGIYTARLIASLALRPEVTQTENLTLTLDTVAPKVSIPIPVDKGYYNKTEMPIVGSITDPNLANYTITAVGSNGMISLDTGTQERIGYSFGTISDLIEDTYTLTSDAKDQGENATKIVRTFTIDRTAPKVTLDTPKIGEFYGNSKNVIDVSGSIIEKNLERYSLRYGAGENPTEWIELAGGDAVPTTSKLFSWKVGKDDGVADGTYTFSLYAKDKAGLEGEAKVKVVVDNTPPEVVITSPKDGSYLATTTDFKGTLNDANLDKGLIEMSEGSCIAAVKWATLKTITTSVKDGVIDTWKLLPADGEYCLRLSATDESGNKAETKIGFRVDTQPPSPPKLSGKTENKTTNSLSWTKSPEADVAGYNVYRNSLKLNSALIATEPGYSDADLKEGSYVYTVKGVDIAGNESASSNAVTLRIDLAGPTVRISSPRDSSTIANLVDIKGTAYSQDDFKEYRVYIGQGGSPSSWSLIRRSPLPISFGSLAQWDTITSLEGSQYTIKLEGEDTYGNISTALAVLTIDNTAPKAPLLQTTTATAADVALTWATNTEVDLAGYLLYRNDQLANVNGIVAGNLKPYLLNGATYSDMALPDGTYRYYLVAMDQAGNSSDQSNTLEVNIDTHPPHMTITAPNSGSSFDGKLMISAETPDNDIASVQFQYRLPQDTSWTNLGAQYVKQPYISYLDPKALNLPYGEYQIQVLATDQHNNVDPAPSVVSVTYLDLTPPDVPSGLAAKVNGADVTLSWSAVNEADVSYNVYRWISGTRSKVNGVPVTSASFIDAAVPDGIYRYEITSVDVAENESASSGQVTAKIYAPNIIQPYTPVKVSALDLVGNGVDPNAMVEITTMQPSGETAKVIVRADSTGSFKLEGITLALGETNFTAVTSDSNGNISKASETVYVAYGTVPAVPTGLVFSALDKDVSLNWDANTETDLLGYYVYRDSEQLNDLNWIQPESALASSGVTHWNDPSYTADGTFVPAWWQMSLVDGNYAPILWQMKFPSVELISELDLNWLNGYAGKDFDLQAWSGHNWVTIKKVVGNDQDYNELIFDAPYKTDGLRLVITATTDSSGQVLLTDASVYADDIAASPNYSYTETADGRYKYGVAAVNSYGFVSDKAEAKSVVGKFPQAPIDLAASAQDSNVTLTWSLPLEDAADLTSYNVYRETSTGWVNQGSVLSPLQAYIDQQLPNGFYRYRVTAVNIFGNESIPSNEVDANVRIIPPLAPLSMTISAPLSGGSLDLAWPSPTGGGAYFYHIYRALNEAGPFKKITATVLFRNNYSDVGLSNGVTYYYRLTTVDNPGNEGDPGSVASGVPLDLITMQPIIMKPTSSGSPFVAYQNQVTVMGLAEPGASVNIMRNSELLGSGTASSKKLQNDVASNLDSSYVSLSPDGSTLAYLNSSSFELRDLANATVKSVSVPLVYLVDIPKWSPSGRYIVILRYDDSWSARLAIYDRTVDTIQVIPTGDSIYNADVSWSPKEDLFVFTGYNSNGQGSPWLANPADVTAVKVAGVASGYYPHLSPDGSRIAYADNQSLMIYNRQDGSVKLVDDNTDGANFAWSSDGAQLAFMSYRDGEGDIYSYDLADGVITRRSFSQKNGGRLVWSPDGSRLGYSTYVEPNELFIAVDRSGTETTVFTTEYGIYGEPEWRSNGELIFIDPVGIHTVYTEGVFSIQLNNLVPGENRLVAIATDTSGNISVPSEAISVILDIGTLPDLSITDNDIVFFPPYPKPGQDVLATARVHNSTNIPVDNVVVAFYLWDGSSDVKLLSSDIIPHIDANGEASASTRFKAGTVAGAATVIAVVDPGNIITEVQETNNYASRDLVVTDQERVLLTSSLNAALYSANQDLYATVTLRNSGLPKSAMLYVALEDATGNLVKLLTNRMTDLPYGADTTQTFVWNSSSTFSGSYRLHALLQDGATVLAKSVSPFTIMPDLSVTGSVVSDKQQYGAGQDVGLTVSMRNSGVNYIIPQLVARVRVLDSRKSVLFTSEQTAANLMPGAPGVLSIKWNSGTVAAGAYAAELEILAGNTLVASSSTGFNIIPSTSIGGSLNVDPAVALLDSSFTANYELVNNGNGDISGTAVVSLIDPDALTVIATSGQAVNIQMGGIVSGSASFTTEALRLKNYLIKLSIIIQGENILIATAPLGVADHTPPVLTVSTLADGSHTNNSVLNVTGTVTDNIGVKQLLINSVSIPFDAFGMFSHALLLKPGENMIEVKATDISGNSVSDSRTIILDQKAPVLVVTSPADNSKTNKQLLEVTGYVDEPCTVEARVNEALQPVMMDGNNFSALLTLLPGADANTIIVTATNLSGLSSSIKRSVYYDDQVPALAITEPDQDLRTNQARVVIRGTASDPYGFGVDVSIDMNGQKFAPQLIDGRFEQAVIFTTEETYHVVVTATNEMGTIATVQRNIIYDTTSPNLTIDPVVTPTNRYPAFLSGTMEEVATVTVFSSTATTGPVEYPTSTTWQTPVSALADNLNTFTVTAVDGAGNRTVATVGIDYDIIPPSGIIVINGGAAYSASTQVTLALSAVDRTGVPSMRFSDDGTIWTTPETYAVSRNWDLAVGDGSKLVYVQYLDNAGNWSAAVSSAITLDTTPPSLSVDPAGGIYGTSQNVKLTASEPTTIYYTLDGSTPTMLSAKYSSPLSIASDTTLKSLAIDLAGNRSDVRTDAFIIDTIPPTLNVSTLRDHSFTNYPVLNIAGSVTDSVGVKELRVNNAIVPFNADGSFSYPIVLFDGDNLIVVSALDLAGHTVSDSRTITLDRKAPQLVITNPSDNSKTGEQLLTVTGYVDEQSTVAVKLGSGSLIAAMNGQDFRADLSLTPGSNTIEVTATDRAGNSNTQKRTVLYDNQVPSVAITVPDKDIRTNQASLLLKGTATDPYTAVAVSLFMDGQTFTPAVINGQFEQLLSFTTEKTYIVSVTAANEVGRTATVQRNVIYDTTAPAFTINPVATPTSQSYQTVTGSRESDLSVQVTCPTAVVSNISYPTATTWSVALTGLQMGDNSIIATSTDAAGNVATVSTRITVAQAAEPIFSHAVFGNKWVKITGGSFTDSYVGVSASYVTAHHEHGDVDTSDRHTDSHVSVRHEHGDDDANSRCTDSHVDVSDSYGTSQHKHGDVGTNSVQICAISLTGGSRIYGVADVGMGGSAGTGVCLTPGTAVSGGKSALPAFKNMTPKPDLGAGVSSGAINLNNVAVKTITTGDYRFRSIKLNGSGKLVISGQVVLHVDGDITLNGAGIIQITAGSSLVIYANGTKLNINGGAIANASQDPKNLVIYGSASLTTVNLSGGTTLHGYLYAPAANIKISGGQQTFGSIIGNTVDLSGGTSVHYPEGSNANGLYN